MTRLGLCISIRIISGYQIYTIYQQLRQDGVCDRNTDVGSIRFFSTARIALAALGQTPVRTSRVFSHTVDGESMTFVNDSNSESSRTKRTARAGPHAARRRVIIPHLPRSFLMA